MQRPMWGSLGKAKTKVGFTFVSKLAVENSVQEKLGVEKSFLQIKSVRSLRKSDMVLNNSTPLIEVDNKTFEVRAV